MELSYRQLELTLGAHFRIHPDRVGTFRSRIRQLQRLDFPPDSKVGKGEKLRYTATQLFQFVAAFELINAGFTGGLAVELVSSKWWNFACGFGLAARHRRLNKLSRRVYIRLLNSTQGDLQGRKEHAEVPQVFIENEDTLASVLKRNDDRVVNTYTLLCASDIVFNVLDLVKRAAQVDNPTYDEEMASWHVNQGGDVEWWMRAEEGWFLDELPPGKPPSFASTILSNFDWGESDIKAKLIADAPWGLSLDDNEVSVLRSYGMLREPRGNSGFVLNEKGTMIWQYLMREVKDGEHP